MSVEISISKTKSLRVNATQEVPMVVDGQAIVDVKHVTYLGSVVTKTGLID